MMELRQIAYAVGVVDEGGFTKAAAALHVSQPALSQGVRALERELGTDLFHRLGRVVVPTAAGHAFLGPARQLLRDEQGIRAAIDAVGGLRSGSIDLVSLPTLAVHPVAALIGSFRRAFPDVEVRLHEPDDADEVARFVVDGRAEIGFAELPSAGDVVTVPLFDQEILAVCPPGTELGRRRRLPVERLAEMRLVTTPPGTSTRRLVEAAIGAAGVAPRIAVETGQREAVVPLVLAGAGTTFLPTPLARAAAERGAVIVGLEPPLIRRIGIVHRRGVLGPAATAFLALVHESFDGAAR